MGESQRCGAVDDPAGTPFGREGEYPGSDGWADHERQATMRPPRLKDALMMRNLVRVRPAGVSMEIRNTFGVAAGIDDVWGYLLDVEKVAPCMPGAELTEVVDDKTWNGRIKAKFGPVALSFAGSVTMEERDDDAHRVTLVAKGRETKGKGVATAKVTSWLESTGAATTNVQMVADIQVTGFVAQVSRGMLPDISARMTDQFAECLRTNMGATSEREADLPAVSTEGDAVGAERTATSPKGSSASRQAASTPVGGLRLAIWALLRSVAKWIRRLSRRDGARKR